MKRINSHIKNSDFCGIDISVLKGLIKEEFQKKPKLIKPNLHALGLGRKYAQENLTSKFGLQLKEH